MENKNIWLRKADMAKKHRKNRASMDLWIKRGILIAKIGEGGVTLVKETAKFKKAKFYKTK